MYNYYRPYMNILAIKCYTNTYEKRSLICKENKNKSGIYCWYNNLTGKIYIGSAVKLNQRLYRYLSKVHLERELLRCNSYIYKSMLKHGYNNFNFYVLIYCSKDNLIKWEQYYINLLKPEYNIMEVAASNLKFKHKESSKKLIGLASIGRPCSEEKKHKLYVSSSSFPLIVKNIETEQKLFFPSIGRAADYIGIYKSHIAKCLIKKGFYEGRGYYITKQQK